MKFFSLVTAATAHATTRTLASSAPYTHTHSQKCKRIDKKSWNLAYDRSNEPRNLFRLRLVSIKIVQKSIPYRNYLDMQTRIGCSVVLECVVFFLVFLFPFCAGPVRLDYLKLSNVIESHDKQIETEIAFFPYFWFVSISVLFEAFVVVVVACTAEKEKKTSSKLSMCSLTK